MDKKAVLLGLALALPLPTWAQRAQAKLECRSTGTDYVYDCIIRLTRGAEPLQGAKITVGADMPSMPMAHNVKPVQAVPGDKPGEYRVTLDLEMQGEWMVKLRLSGPLKDQLMLRYEFDASGARPLKRADRPPRK